MWGASRANTTLRPTITTVASSRNVEAPTSAMLCEEFTSAKVTTTNAMSQSTRNGRNIPIAVTVSSFFEV